MSMLPQPYPDRDPWEPFEHLVTNGWDASAQNDYLRGRIVGNTAEIQGRIRVGDTTIAAALPAEFRPPAQLSMAGFVPDLSKHIYVLIWASGQLRILQADHAEVQGRLVIFSEAYPRRA